MFWRYNALTSHIDTLLDKKDVTLHELMDEDDILQECKGQNHKLIEFLILPEVMDELVKLITCEPGDDVEEKVKYKYPNIACELLTSDVTQILEKLVENNTLIDKVYSFLLNEGPLNPLLASFFTKVLGILLVRKADYLFEYLTSKEDFLGHLLSHIGTSAIMDLLMRLVTYDPMFETKAKILKWMDDEDLVVKLVHLMRADQSDEVHCNVTTTLCDIVRFGREQLGSEVPQPDPLLEKLECDMVLNVLLANMLDSSTPSESVITNGLLILQTILEYRRQISSFDDWRPLPEGCAEPLPQSEVERMDKAVKCVLAAVKPRIGQFANLLTNPPQQSHSKMVTTVGVLDPPLGNTRLQVSRLFATLFAVDESDLHLCLIENDVVNKLLDLFFHYIWNNFLHTQIEVCISNILTKKDSGDDGSPRILQDPQSDTFTPTMLTQEEDTPLVTHLFKDCRIITRMVEAWQENDEAVKSGSKRKGYMGHVTKICNDIVAATDKGVYSALIGSLLDGLPEDTGEKWVELTTNQLAETNKRNTSDLVGGHPLNSSSGSDSDSDFKDIPFPQDDSMQQQAFSDYQMQQLTSNFIDQFGLNEEEFGASSMRIEAAFTHKISSLDWSTDTSEKEPKEYEDVCNMDGGDSGEEEDLWKDKEITFNTTESSRSISTSNTAALADSDSDNSSDDDLISSPVIIKSQVDDDNMDIDTTTSSEINPVAPIAMDTSPWDTDTTNTGGESEEWTAFEGAENTNSNENTEWADFSNLDSSPASDGGPRVSSPEALVDTESSEQTPVATVQPGNGCQTNTDNINSESIQQAPVDIASNTEVSSDQTSQGETSVETSKHCSDVMEVDEPKIATSSEATSSSPNCTTTTTSTTSTATETNTAHSPSSKPNCEEQLPQSSEIEIELPSAVVTGAGGDNSQSSKHDLNGPTLTGEDITADTTVVDDGQTKAKNGSPA